MRQCNTDRQFAVSIGVAERRSIDALRRSRRAAVKPEHVDLAEDVSRNTFNHRYQGPRHIAVILRDAFERGASEADLRAFPNELNAIITSWIAQRDGEKPLQLADVHQVEERIEGEREVAELAFVYDKSPATAIRLIEAIQKHECANAPLEMCARQYLEVRGLA